MNISIEVEKYTLNDNTNFYNVLKVDGFFNENHKYMIGDIDICICDVLSDCINANFSECECNNFILDNCYDYDNNSNIGVISRLIIKEIDYNNLVLLSIDGDDNDFEK